jgi:hypothetical protein
MESWLEMDEDLYLKRVRAKDVTKRVRWVDEIEVICEKREREERGRGMSRYGGCWRFAIAFSK